MKFFNDCTILNGEEGVGFVYARDGRFSGNAFVEFSSKEDSEKALEHNKEHIGKRYIEVELAEYSEMEWQCKRLNPNHQQEQPDIGSVVRLRGLPYSATKQDIADFFLGLDIVPYGITITMNGEGRASGDGYVE